MISGHLDKTYRGWEIYNDYMDLLHIAVKMRKWGIAVSHEARVNHRNSLEPRCQNLRETFYLRTNNAYKLGKNGQHHDVANLFFNKLGVQPTKWSPETNKPSLDSSTLAMLHHASDNVFVKQLAGVVLDYRQSYKLLQDYVEGLPISEVTGRIHSTWKVHGTVTGRWASAEPNMQNIPAKMRDIFVARPGNVIVGADYSALELRIIALFAKDEPMLRWFREGIDTHKATAAAIFKIPLEQVTKEQRNLAKIAEYSFNYNDSVDVTTALRQAQKRFPNVTLKQMQLMRKVWFQEHPAIARWQKETLRRTQFLSYIEEPISGRREYFHDGVVDANKALNFSIQGYAGSLMNAAMKKLDKMVNWKDVGIIAQVHDAAYIEGPAERADELCAMLKEAMECTTELDGVPMEFPVDTHAGASMLEAS